jgi:hypothetical protein
MLSFPSPRDACSIAPKGSGNDLVSWRCKSLQFHSGYWYLGVSEKGRQRETSQQDIPNSTPGDIPSNRKTPNPNAREKKYIQ